MAIQVELPALGESVVEGTVSRWLVKEGDAVERDQPLVEITTDKVDAEIPAPEAGTIASIRVPEGETVEVGTVLVTLEPGKPDSAAPQKKKKKNADEATTRSAPEASHASAGEAGARSEAEPSEARTRTAASAGEAGARSEAEPSEVHQDVSESASETDRSSLDSPRATPVARRMAEDAGVDLTSIDGSGDAGRVTRADVERARTRETAPPPRRPAPARREAETSPPYLRYQLQEGDKVIKMSPLRKIVAEHMVLSKATSPHVGTVAEVDMGGVVQFRDRHKRSFREQHGYSLTFLPFIVHATVRALRETPRLNSSVVEDAIVEKRDVHISIAVETEKGLVVPVIRHADRLSLTGLAASIEDLSSRARNKKLSPDDLQGGTFTVSNPGRNGNLYGFAIINQPQVGILRMGEIVKRPVVRAVDGADAIVIRPMMHLALSYDHRAVDGAPANGFLFRVRELLEEAEFDL